jgi:phosphoserine phosphatase RsbU/P
VEINTELEMARQIQLSILPNSTPKIAGMEIVARYIPMTSVAGDFYDFIVVDATHIGILIADVSGHGLPAALIASMLQVALTAQARHASEPGKVLAGLNHALCGKFQHNFVTAAYVYVDLEKNTMTYGGAGHPPLLLWRKATGAASQLLENGLVLGQFEEATYDSLQIPIEAGDRFVLYTDGILETANPAQEEFGTGRFMQFMETNSKLAAGPFADGLMLELAHWLEQPPGEGHKDDISLVTVDFTAR